MQFAFTFRHLDHSDALQKFAKEKLLSETEKFEFKPLEAQVTFDQKGDLLTAQCHIFGGGIDLTAEATKDDIYKAVDSMAAKMARQLRKEKGKRKHHHDSQFVHHNLKLAEVPL